MEELKQEMSLDVLKVSGTVRRTSQYLKTEVTEGTQNSSVEKCF